MSIVNEVLSRTNLKYEDLTTAEKETLSRWSKVLDSNQLSIPVVIDFVRTMRNGIEEELSKENESPHTWVGVIALFIPFYGLLKKWYQDQRRIQMEARVRNLVLLESFLTSPEKAKKAIDAAIAGIVSNRKV
jgi:hypothetical protein